MRSTCDCILNGWKERDTASSPNEARGGARSLPRIYAHVRVQVSWPCGLHAWRLSACLEGLLGDGEQRHLDDPVASGGASRQAVDEAVHQALHDRQLRQQVRWRQVAQTRLRARLLRLLSSSANRPVGAMPASPREGTSKWAMRLVTHQHIETCGVAGCHFEVCVPACAANRHTKPGFC